MDCEDCEHFDIEEGDCWGVPMDAQPTEDEYIRHEQVMEGKRPVEECPWFDKPRSR